MELLPNELIDDIADTLNSTDFFALYQSNRQVRRILAPQLWRQLTLGTCSKAGVVELANSIPIEPSRYKRRICLNSKRSVVGFIDGITRFPELYQDVLSAVRLLNMSVTFDDHPSSPPQNIGLTELYRTLTQQLELNDLEDIEIELYADEKDCKSITELVFEKWPNTPCSLSLGLRTGSGRMMEGNCLPGSPDYVEIAPLKFNGKDGRGPPIKEIRIYYMSIQNLLSLMDGKLPTSLQKLSIQQRVKSDEIKRLNLDQCPNLKKLSLQDTLVLTDADWIPKSVTQLQYKEASPVIPSGKSNLVPCAIPQVESLKVELSTAHSLEYMKFTHLQDLELEEGPWSNNGIAVARAVRNMIVPNVGSLSTLRFHDVEYRSIEQLVENAHSARVRNLIILGCRDSFQYNDTGKMSRHLPHLRALVLDLPDQEITSSPASEDEMVEADGEVAEPPARRNLERDFAWFIYQFLVNCPDLKNVYGVAWPDCFIPRNHRYFKDHGPDILYGVSMRQINLDLIRREVDANSLRKINQ